MSGREALLYANAYSALISSDEVWKSAELRSAYDWEKTLTQVFLFHTSINAGMHVGGQSPQRLSRDLIVRKGPLLPY